MLKKLKEACDASSDVVDAYAAYLAAISKARKKYEDVAEDMKKVIDMPRIDLDTFEIDG